MFKTSLKKESILLGKWTVKYLNSILYESSRISDTGERINFLSRLFLGIPYKESTLIGGLDTAEVFVINFEGVDCFTFLDYVESMRLSGSFSKFMENLKRVRYQNAVVSYKGRNHFFSDWIEFNKGLVDDVTEQLGIGILKSIQKMLNLKDDGTYFLKGIQPRKRRINYIASHAVKESVLNNLKTGDYIGIYSEKQGLDVSHVGIVIRDGERISLRHATSVNPVRRFGDLSNKIENSPPQTLWSEPSNRVKGKVIDEDLKEYLKEYLSDKSGIIVLRPKD